MRTFFGCEECGRNFESAASTDSAAAISSPEQEVMWLWNQHNEVNYRLAGSLSDDPMFPKTAWPPPSLCASCHEENRGLHAFNRQEVLRFLLRHYGDHNLSGRYSVQPETATTSRREEENEDREVGQKVAGLNESLQQKDSVKDSVKESIKDTVGEEGRESGEGGTRTLALGFNSVDMSLCLLLYVGSCLFLMLLFFFFRVRSRRWKLRPPKLAV